MNQVALWFLVGLPCVIHSDHQRIIMTRIIPYIYFVFLIAAVCIPARFAYAKDMEQYMLEGVTVVHATQTEPHYFKGHDGRAQGILVDFWELWSRKTGIPVRFRMTSWQDSLKAAAEGESDIHGGMVVMPDREKLFDFSVPFYSIDAVLLVAGPDKVPSKKIYSEYTIGTVAGTHSDIGVRDRRPEAKVVSYKTPQEVVAALASGKVNAASIDLPTFHFNNAKLETPLQFTVCEVFSSNTLHAGVRKGDQELLRIVNDGLRMIDESEQKMIVDRWFVIVPEGSGAKFGATWLGLVLLALVGAGIVFIRRIGRKA